MNLKPDDRHPASLPIEQLREECELRFQRRSGPGGQHRNKVETSVHLRHIATDIRAAASERRAQAANLKVAWQRLRIQLAIGLRRPWQSPSQLWKTRCQAGRLTISERHDDFPTLLAEALDALAAHDWDHRVAAEHLKCSATQLVRFLGREPQALGLLNGERESRGQKPLK